MKKIIIGTLAITLSLTLAACGTSANSATINSLGNQLDDTANSISNMQTINPTDLNISKSMLENVTASGSSGLYENALNTQQMLLNEQYYKTDILRQTANIKNCLSKDTKLSKTQNSAVKELTSSLSKYTNSIEYSENEMNTTVKSIASMKKNADKNSAKINAKLNRLVCNSNARSAYYENLLNTLYQLENCLGVECEEDVPENNTDISAKTIDNTKQNTTKSNNEINSNNLEDRNLTKNKNIRYQKNIDTYINNTTSNEANEIEETDEFLEERCPNCHEIYRNETVVPQNQFYDPGYYNNYPITGRNPYNRYYRYNPSRNTDTYGPTMRNIDTYGINGYNTNGIYNGVGVNNYGYNGVYNGINNNVGMNGIYGNGTGYGYGVNGLGINNLGVNGLNRRAANRIYNSNNYNRLTTPVLEQNATLANAESTMPEQRLEDFEQMKEDSTIEKIDRNKYEELKTKNVAENSNKTTYIISNPENISEVNHMEDLTFYEKDSAIHDRNPLIMPLNKEENSAKPEISNFQRTREFRENNELLNVSNLNTFKTPQVRIVDMKNKNEIENNDDLNQPIIAHRRGPHHINFDRSESNKNLVND